MVGKNYRLQDIQLSKSSAVPPRGRPGEAHSVRLAVGSKDENRNTGGANRDRTGDLLLAKQALSQLSYGPVVQVGFPWWVWVDLNHRPHAYQACALTS